MSKKPKTDEESADVHLPASEPIATSEPSIAAHAEKISTAWFKSVLGIIEAGQLLLQAKAELGHGQFQTLFSEKRVPFSDRTAQRLMEIASNPILSNPTHLPVLPGSWTTLHAMTAIPPPKLEQLLSDGKITSDTGRKEVAEIAAKIEKDETLAAIVAALTLLIGLMQKWPDAESLAPLLEGQIKSDDVTKLAEWLGELDPGGIPPALRRT